MHAQRAAFNAPPAMTPNRPTNLFHAAKARVLAIWALVASLFAEGLAMLVPKAQASTDASALVSRRAMLKMVREDRGNADAMQDIAISFVLLALALVIALAFWPIITSTVAAAVADDNTTTTQATLLGLLPTILVAVLLIGSIAFLVQGVKKFRT